MARQATTSPAAVARIAAPVTGATAAGIVKVVITGAASPPSPWAVTEMRTTAPARTPGNDAVVAVVSTRFVVPSAVAAAVNPMSSAPGCQEATRDPLSAAAISRVTGATGVADGVGDGRIGTGNPEDVGVGDGVGVDSSAVAGAAETPRASIPTSRHADANQTRRDMRSSSRSAAGGLSSMTTSTWEGNPAHRTAP